MYNFLAVLILAVLLFGAVGCSNDNKGSDGDSSNAPAVSSSVEQAQSLSSLSSSSISSFSSMSSTPEASSSREAESSQGAMSSLSTAQRDDSWCDEFSTTGELDRHNRYIFNAPDGECFGIINDAAQKKTIPISVGSFDDEDALLLEITGEAKITNNYSNPFNKRKFIAIEIVNTSRQLLCSIRIRDIDLLGADGNVLANFSGGALDGDFYQFSRFRNTCIGPGEAVTYVNSSLSFSPSSFDSIVSARIGSLDAGNEERFTPVANLTPVSATVDWTGLPNYPKLAVEFLNELDSSMKLEDSTMVVQYFDLNGYPVGLSVIRLDEGLGKDDESDLVADDYIVNPGERLILADTILDLAAVQEGTAQRMVVFLELRPID